MRKTSALLTLAAAAVLVLASCGGGGDGEGRGEGDDHVHTVLGEPAEAAAADRTIEVTADDPFTFSPGEIEVTEGETILFRVTNEGQSLHEFVLGPDDDGHVHGEDGDRAVHLEPGETKELAWTFSGAGHLDFACYIPGHKESGMEGTINVSS